MDREHLRLIGRIGAHVGHARHDPNERLGKARAAFQSRFELEADPDGVLPPEERARRAQQLRKAHYARLAYLSAEARRRRARGPLDVDRPGTARPGKWLRPTDVGADFNALRAPIWLAVKSGPRVIPHTDLGLWRHPLKVSTASSWPSHRDLLLYIHICTEYLNQGLAASRWIYTTLSRAARQMGLLWDGGSTRREVRRGLERLTGVTVESAVKTPGQSIVYLGWHLVDQYVVRSNGVDVQLSERVAATVSAGGFVKMNQRALLSLAQADLIATRLWVFLEAESLPREWHYRVFGINGEPSSSWDLPPLSVMLQLTDRNRSRVAARIRQAIDHVHQVDPLYGLSLHPARSGSDVILTVNKTRRAGARKAGQLTYSDRELV